MQYPDDAVENTPLIHTRYTVRLSRKPWPDGDPLIFSEFIAQASGLVCEFGSYPADTLNTEGRSQAVLGPPAPSTTSAIGGNSENIYSQRVLPPVTPSRHRGSLGWRDVGASSRPPPTQRRRPLADTGRALHSISPTREAAMAKGRRKSNREAKKPKKSAAEKSKSAAISISIQAPGASHRGRVNKGANA
jgi:hypothetical protein